MIKPNRTDNRTYQDYDNLKVQVTTRQNENYTLECKYFRLFLDEKTKANAYISFYEKNKIKNTELDEYAYIKHKDLGKWEIIKHREMPPPDVTVELSLRQV